MGLNEVAPRFNLIAHQDGKDLIHASEVFKGHPQERSYFWVHGRFPELSRVHFSETFIALNAEALLSRIQNDLYQLIRGLKRLFLALGLELVRGPTKSDRRGRQFLELPEVSGPDQVMCHVQFMGDPARVQPAGDFVRLMLLVHENIKRWSHIREHHGQ